jgi:DNA-damage-inducible protein J
MAKTASINMKIDPIVKDDIEGLYSQYGLTLTDAINIFIAQSLKIGGLPFDLKPSVPNDETLAAMKESDEIIKEIKRTGKGRFASAEDMFRSLEE